MIFHDRRGSNRLDVAELKKVNTFKYMGCNMPPDGNEDKKK